MASLAGGPAGLLPEGADGVRDRISLTYLAVQNLRRRPARSLLSAVGVVLATGTLFAVLLGLAGVRQSMAVGMQRLGADLLVVPAGEERHVQEALIMGTPTSFYMDHAAAAHVAGIQGVLAVSPQVYIETLESASCCTGRLMVVAFDPATDFTVRPWLGAGSARTLGPHEVVAGRLIIPPVGQPIRLYGQDFTIAAKLVRTGMGLDETVFMTMEAAYAMAAESAERAEKPLRLPQGAISALLVRVEDWVAPPLIVRQIQALVPGVDVIQRDQVSRTVVDGYLGTMRWVLGAAGVALATAVLLVAVMFFAVVSERQRELGLLRAMGASAGGILRLILTEAVLLTTAGGAAGILLGGGGFALFKDRFTYSLRVPYLWPGALELAGLIGGTLLLAALAGLVAGAVPAWRSARMEPYAAIRQGE